MNTREQLIQFQNQAEKDFEDKKNATTLGRYLLAMIVFFSSTLLATFTWPVRILLKTFSKKETDGQILKMTNDNIDAILKKEHLVLIDFWAEWCGPCVMMNPTLEAFAASSKDITVTKVNADTNQAIVSRFKIRGIPQLVLMKNGQEIKRHAGPMTRLELARFCGM